MTDQDILQAVLFEVEKGKDKYLFRCVEHIAIYGEVDRLEDIIPEAIGIAEYIFSTWNKNEITRNKFQRVRFPFTNYNQFRVDFNLNTGESIAIQKGSLFT
jgi:hypothetical protein